jgi:hypothetical protein
MSKRNKREKVKAKHNELFFFYPFPTNLRGDKMVDLDESMEGRSLYFHSLPLLLLNQTKDCLSFPSRSPYLLSFLLLATKHNALERLK